MLCSKAYTASNGNNFVKYVLCKVGKSEDHWRPRTARYFSTYFVCFTTREFNLKQLLTNQLPAGWTQAISTDRIEQKCKTGFVWSSTHFASTNFAYYIRDPWWSLKTSSENVGQGLPWAMKSTKKCTCTSTIRMKVLYIST